MKFSTEDLLEIVAKSTTIMERLNSKSCFEKKYEEKAINSRLQEWCQVVADGDWIKFKKYLELYDIRLEKIDCILGSEIIPKQSEPINLPKWIEILNESIEIAKMGSFKDLSTKNNNNALNSNYPFEDLFLPFIHLARQNLISQTGTNYQLLSQDAHTSLEQNLLARLSYMCAPTLELEFSTFKVLRQSTIISLCNKSKKGYSRKKYEEFIKEMLHSRLTLFFKEYPVLARLVGTTINFWIDSSAKFIDRLALDWTELKKIFSEDFKKVISVQTGLSDYHNNGNSVMVIQFDSGLKLVYKPKNLDLEICYFKLLSWLNKQSILLPLKVLKILHRSDYGWVEFVNSLPCKNIEEIKRFYYRSGMQLCLAYVLEATDLHNENVIACSEHPVLIDLETLMHPRMREANDIRESLEMAYTTHQEILHSVMNTGLLPQWHSPFQESHIQEDIHVYDPSGLGGFDQQRTFFRVRQWRNINTDNMELSYDHETCSEIKENQHLNLNNVPILNDLKVPPTHFLEEIIHGFKTLYYFLIDKKNELLQINSPLHEFSNVPVRFVFRPTYAYTLLLEKLNHPKFMRDGIERSLQLESLSKLLLSSDFASLLIPLVEEEKKAMEQYDIPRILASSDCSNFSFGSNKMIKNCFTSSSFEIVVKRIKSLNNNDLEKNISFIEGSFFSRFTINESNYSLSTQNNNFNTFNNIACQNSEQIQEVLVEQSIKIGISLKKRAVYSLNGCTNWIAPQYSPRLCKYQLNSLSWNLYEGSLGVALFFAALGKITNDTEFIQLALSSLKPSLMLLQEEKDVTHSEHFVGMNGILGYGSIVYTLVRIAKILENEMLLSASEKVAAMITPELITNDQQFDIIGGVAGTILGLIALYDVFPNSKIKNQITLCGEHLLNNRVSSDSGYKSWKTLNGKLLTGFSHGAAGIAYSLLRSYKISGQTVFLEAAQESISYERSVFNREVGNWPDFRFPSTEDLKYQCGWAHGAPGIGLARVAGLDILNTDEIQEDIESAIKTTMLYGLSHLDHLCNGNLGRVEFLFTAAQKSSQPQLQEIAMTQVEQIIARAKQKGTFGYEQFLTFNPVFFEGAAGIGYEFLRLAYPDLLPSVLILE